MLIFTEKFSVKIDKPLQLLRMRPNFIDWSLDSARTPTSIQLPECSHQRRANEAGFSFNNEAAQKSPDITVYIDSVDADRMAIQTASS